MSLRGAGRARVALPLAAAAEDDVFPLVACAAKRRQREENRAIERRGAGAFPPTILALHQLRLQGRGKLAGFPRVRDLRLALLPSSDVLRLVEAVITTAVTITP